MFLSLKTLYRKRTVIWPFYFYTIIRTLSGLTSDTWNLKYKQLKNINIDIPVLEEQEKIGDFFKKMDILISKQKMKIEILEKEKQSFLQKMFL
ncbi:type I restriction modification DNA specificity domain protein [Staphylococcus aureus subsp. aureus IS-125]|nr:type I restriction modification DNA specificity domain protein [Staphylococcus aureus subsp. aureus IS-125]